MRIAAMSKTNAPKKALMWDRDRFGMNYIDQEVEIIAETKGAYKFRYWKFPWYRERWLPKRLYDGRERFEDVSNV